MGLNIRVGEYESAEYMCEEMGSYGGYHHWREQIAKSVGFNLNEMVGFGGVTPWTDEPFQLILCHSDCDGLYTVNQLHKLLKEIHEIKRFGIDYLDQSDKYIKLINHAIKINKPLVFE